MAVTLEQLLDLQTADELKAKLLGSLNTAGFPISDWHSGGVPRTLVEMQAGALVDFAALMPLVAAGGYLDYAEGEWLTLHAKQRYDIERTLATFTIQTVELTDAGAGPHNVNQGDLIVESTAGNRYILNEAGTIPLNNPISLEFIAEEAGAKYNDGPDSIFNLVTSLAGVTAINSAPVFTGVSHSGSGSGTITPSRTSVLTPPTRHTFIIKVTSSGQVGAATFNYATDGGAEASGGVMAATYDLPGGTRVTFADGAATPSFILGDTFSFTTPGTPIVQQGRDDESDEELRRRCRARWPSLAAIPTEGKYQLWAKAASAEVTKVSASPSGITPGQVDVIIAGAVNPLSGAVVSAVQDYIRERLEATELTMVTAATTHPVGTLGTVVVKASRLAAVQQAAQQAWNAYIAALPAHQSHRAVRRARTVLDGRRGGRLSQPARERSPHPGRQGRKREGRGRKWRYRRP